MNKGYKGYDSGTPGLLQRTTRQIKPATLIPAELCWFRYLPHSSSGQACHLHESQMYKVRDILLPANNVRQFSVVPKSFPPPGL